MNYIPPEKRNLDDCKTVEQVDNLIMSARIDQEKWFIDTHDKSQASDLYARELGRLRKFKKFLKLGVAVEKYAHVGLLIEGKFVVGFHKKRWRVKGQNKWYWYKDEEDLVNKYINCEPIAADVDI